MVIADIPDSHGAPADFWVCKLIEVMHGRQLCVAFNQCSVGNETLRPDMVALWPVQLRSSIWSNDVFWVLDNDGGSVPAFNSVYFQGAEPTEEIEVAALHCNPTLALALVSAADAGTPVSPAGPHTSFVANDGITWVPSLSTGVVDAGMRPQPMNIGSGDRHVSDTGASVHSMHSTHSVLGALVGDASSLVFTTQAVPSSSTSVTPASIVTGHSQTPISTTPLSYPGTSMPLTHLPVGTAVGTVDLEASRQAWLGLMKDRVNKLLNASTILCQEYSDIVQKYSSEIEVAHTDTLLDLNKYSMALCVAIGEWRVDVERAVQVLGTSLGITAFNTQAEIVRVKTSQFREKVDGTEAAFLASKRKTEAERAALLELMKTELGTKIHAAIQKFVASKMAAALDIVGLTGDMAPFVAQITQESADFWTRIA